MSTCEQIQALREQIAKLGTKIAECERDTSCQKKDLTRWLREVRRLGKQLEELEELSRKLPRAA